MTITEEWRSSERLEANDEWSYPTRVFIGEQIHNIRNNCDYRVVLDCISALNDTELSNDDKLRCALYIFYDDSSEIEDTDMAIKEMFRIISGGNDNNASDKGKPRLMDWKHDFSYIAPPINKALGYDVRDPEKYTHWYSFLGGYMEIGECTFSTIVSIRSKRAKGQKLDKWEIEYLREHRNQIELPVKLTSEEQEILDSDW